jgi:hypothetical protein
MVDQVVEAVQVLEEAIQEADQIQVAPIQEAMEMETEMGTVPVAIPLWMEQESSQIQQ